jgi:mono/diheme cytochrome c family protein/glucose/arabinose dehydrogenase
MHLRHALTLLIATLPLAAQKGNRAEHANMAPVVPQNLIPASPVLTPAQAQAAFELAPGFVIEPFATEPLVEKPVAVDFDPAGRAWVVEMIGYMLDLDAKDEDKSLGRIIVLEDTDHDGKADKRTVFLENIHLPRAVAVYPDGILYADNEDLKFIKRDGLKAVGKSIIAAEKFIEAGNVEHRLNGLMRNLDNWHYNAKAGKRVRRSGDQWIVEKTAFRGQWGISRDDFGRLYHNNNSTFLFGDLLAPNFLDGNPGVPLKLPETVQLGPNDTYPIRVTPGVNRAYIAKANGYSSDTLDPKTHKLLLTTASAGPVIYRGSNFPKEWYGRGMVPESVVNLVKTIEIENSDLKLSGSHPLGKKEFLASTDERFRPVNLSNAPDGTLWVLDFYHGIIQDRFFMTSYLRDQYASRKLDGPSTGHGRIWRIRHSDGKLAAHQNFESMATAEVVAALKHTNAWQRDMAQRVLVDRQDPSSIPLLRSMLGSNAPAVSQVIALWTLEGLGKLTAADISATISATDTQLVCSALWASTKLSDEEQAILAPKLCAFAPRDLEQAVYLARTLGPIGNEAAFAALKTLLIRHADQPLLKAAAFSGLNNKEKAFATYLQGSFNDKTFLTWLEQGAGNAVVSSAAKLKGKVLQSYNRGKAHYSGAAACFGCHGAAGEGVPNLGPPLDASEWVTGQPQRLVKILLHGLTGPVTVAGITYKPTADMPGLAQNPLMKDQDIADIATYIRNEWSNQAKPVSKEAVQSIRKETADRVGRPYSEMELRPKK